MRLIIKGFLDGQKLQAIKGIRAVSGVGLKEAKEIADRLPGEIWKMEIDPRVVNLATTGQTLDQHYVLYEFETSKVRIEDLIDALRNFPSEITINVLIRTLEGIRRISDG